MYPSVLLRSPKSYPNSKTKQRHQNHRHKEHERIHIESVPQAFIQNVHTNSDDVEHIADPYRSLSAQFWISPEKRQNESNQRCASYKTTRPNENHPEQDEPSYYWIEEDPHPLSISYFSEISLS